MRFEVGRRLLAESLDFLLPQACVVCGQAGASLHPECLDTFPRAEGPRCVRCWAPGVGTWCDRCARASDDGVAFDGLRAPFRFAGDARRALLEVKFRGVTAHLPVLAPELLAVVPVEWRFDVVVPVPLAAGRRRRRGYNQAAVLAQALGRTGGLRVREDLVARVRSTPPQAALSAEQRWRNLDGAFTVRGVPPEGVLLVDDVTTTGATCSAIAAALKAAGAERVFAVAAARED